jgi:hypothetical protein
VLELVEGDRSIPEPAEERGGIAGGEDALRGVVEGDVRAVRGRCTDERGLPGLAGPADQDDREAGERSAFSDSFQPEPLYRPDPDCDRYESPLTATSHR